VSLRPSSYSSFGNFCTFFKEKQEQVSLYSIQIAKVKYGLQCANVLHIIQAIQKRFGVLHIQNI
jgi:hypothetical protein